MSFSPALRRTGLHVFSCILSAMLLVAVASGEDEQREEEDAFFKPRIRISTTDAKFASPVVTAQTPGHAVEIDLAIGRAKEIYLVVTDAGDGIACDFGNWAEPRFVTAGKIIKLTEVGWKEAKTSWGEIAIGRNAEGGPLRIHGKRVSYGIGTHANSYLVFDVPEGATRFQARAGLDSQGTDEGCGSTVRFFVFTTRPKIELLRDVPDEDGRDDQAVREFSEDRFFGSRRDRTGRATPADRLRMPDGFQAELLYTVPLDTQGSWVCLTSDPRGRLIASAQWGGLFRITPPPVGAADVQPQVEPLDIRIGNAQGLLCAFDSLYVVVNSDTSGLYRVHDSNGDDQFDQVELLRRFDGGGEHGPHGVVLGPKGRRLYLVGGNGTYLSPPPRKSLVPGRWCEDRLLRRIGASDGSLAENRPGGWICRTDPEGKTFELVAMGFRNPYDIAFNPDGELFTFDSDMEWDAGTPWYRPNRVNHVISGADFGWRAGTAKWPADYLDSCGSVVDIGFASPTGVVFGGGARFPVKYQRALFIADWSLGHIYAVHLEPKGASYTGTFERFVTAAPLPVTDLVVHPHDGAMYFTVGGRGVTSALYRITYVGSQPTPAVERRSDKSADLRKLRQRLEAHHHPQDGALDTVWPFLAHEDRAIRYAARVAIEHQSLSKWRQRALNERNPRALIAATAAMARHADRALQPRMVEALSRLDWNTLSLGDRLDLLRTYTLVLTRLGQPGNESRERILEAIDDHFPSGHDALDRELAEILTFVQAPRVIPRTLKLLSEAKTQEMQIHYAMCLRDMRDGWTLEGRREYFDWFRRAEAHRGGVSFGGYLEQIKRDAVAHLSGREKADLGNLLYGRRFDQPVASSHRRQLVREWSVRDLVPQLADAKRGDAGRGQAVFSDALCYRCHRVGGQGGLTGPDLTGVARRFNTRDLLEAILEPSRVVSDQYRAVQVVTTDGRVITGKITDLNGNTLVLMNDPLDPAKLVMIARDKIDEMTYSNVSMMPQGVLNTFTSEEIADLIAFLRQQAGVEQEEMEKSLPAAVPGP